MAASLKETGNTSSARTKRLRKAAKAMREAGLDDVAIAEAMRCDLAEVTKALGRGKAIIDLEQVTQLYAIGCTDEDVAGVLGVSLRTIERRNKQKAFREAKREGTALGKSSVRRSQFENATQNNNATMQIWLGKQWLGQKQHPVEERKRGGSFRVVFDEKGNESRERHRKRLADRRAEREKDQA
jgi:hypothetical protein